MCSAAGTAGAAAFWVERGRCAFKQTLKLRLRQDLFLIIDTQLLFLLSDTCIYLFQIISLSNNMWKRRSWCFI